MATNVRQHFALLYAPLKYTPLIKAVMKGERGRSASIVSLNAPVIGETNSNKSAEPEEEDEEDEKPKDYTKAKILLAEGNS